MIHHGVGRVPDRSETAPTQARNVVVCLPHAGGNATSFRTWVELAPRDVTVRPLKLRGRLDRLHEAPLTSIDAIVDELVADPRWYPDGSWALFGHSMGAVVAYELVRRMRACGLSLPSRLIVSGHRAPHLLDPSDRISDLADGPFLREVARMGGIPDAVMSSRDLCELILPALRADFVAIDRYCYQSGPPLDIPITVAGGSADPLVSASELSAWRSHTTGSFALRMFSGGHFYVYEHSPELLRLALEAP